jgi:hypothetical protein
MAWGRGDALFITDVDCIRKVTLDGTVSTHARGITDRQSRSPSSQQINQLFGLTFDEAGNCYVTDFGSRGVKHLNPNGEVTRVLHSEPHWAPVGVAVHRQSLYVMEIGIDQPGPADGPRVRRITRDGVATTLATVQRKAVPSRP